MTQPPLDDTALAHEALMRICDHEGVFRRVAGVLELVAHSGVGLGEVLQDFANQACVQLHEIVRAATHAAAGAAEPQDAEALANIPFVLKSVKSVLEMTPPAMLRNKADTLGEKEKLSRADISGITHTFVHSPEVVRLLAAEDAGQFFAPLLAAAHGGGSLSPAVHGRLLAPATH